MLRFDANEPLTLCRSWVDPIRESLVWVHFHRELWRDVTAELDSEPNPVSTAWRNHYFRLYVDSQVAAVRRMAEGTSRDEISLAQLLLTMQENVTSFDLERLSVIGTQACISMDRSSQEWLLATDDWVEIDRSRLQRDELDASSRDPHAAQRVRPHRKDEGVPTRTEGDQPGRNGLDRSNPHYDNAHHGRRSSGDNDPFVQGRSCRRAERLRRSSSRRACGLHIERDPVESSVGVEPDQSLAFAVGMRR